jgi:hypothetical protein
MTTLCGSLIGTDFFGWTMLECDSLTHTNSHGRVTVDAGLLVATESHGRVMVDAGLLFAMEFHGRVTVCFTPANSVSSVVVDSDRQELARTSSFLLQSVHSQTSQLILHDARLYTSRSMDVPQN